MITEEGVDLSVIYTVYYIFWQRILFVLAAVGLSVLVACPSSSIAASKEEELLTVEFPAHSAGRLRIFDNEDKIVSEHPLVGKVRIPIQSRFSLLVRDTSDFSFLKNLQRSKLSCLNLSKSNFSRKDVPLVASLKSLQILNLSETEVDNDSLKLLTSLPQLQNLALDATDITGDGLKQIGQLKTLRSLQLGRNALSSASMKYLCQLPLVYLSVRQSSLDDKALDYIKLMPNLKMLDISDNKVTGDGLAKLAGSKLFALHISRCLCATPSISALCKLPNLHALSLQGFPVKAAFCREIAKIKTLRRLDITGYYATKHDVLPLSALPNLKILRVSAKPADCQEIAKLFPSSIVLNDHGKKRSMTELFHSTNEVFDALEGVDRKLRQPHMHFPE